MHLLIPSLTDLRPAAREFLAQLGSHRVVAFYGQMGAGKTTFIKALCEELGSPDVITSPTFAIVNEYSIASERFGSTVYHFDFYRIRRLEEFYDMGGEDYFDSGSLCFIEWPELIEPVLPPDALRISITQQPAGPRLIQLLPNNEKA